MIGFPTRRMRRLRRTAGLRRLVAEARLARSQLVWPLFFKPAGEATPVSAMPGVMQHPIKDAGDIARRAADLGLGAVLLFGLPAGKDEQGSGAYHEKGVIQETVRAMKRAATDLVVITDVCLCEYTSHGHCGMVRDGTVDNDATLELLAKTAVSHAAAGADVVAPSDMMDGRVGAIRRALDDKGFADTVMLSYAAKYASAFYGPFRVAAESAPQFGDRRGYQMDPANGDEAMKEIALDLDEGADFVMVKPALPCLDIIRRARERFGGPIAAYQVSGEYTMIKLAAQTLSASCNPRMDFIGHVGGDDFILLFQSADWESRCERVLEVFAQDAQFLFDEPERIAGVLKGEDRVGRPETFPLTSLAIGIVKVEPGLYTSHLHVSTAASEAKKQAKRLCGNAMFVERRQPEDSRVMTGSNCDA